MSASRCKTARHIIDVAHMDRAELLKTDLKLVSGWLKRRSQADELREFVEEHREAFQNLAEDAYDMIAVYSNTQGLTELKSIATTGEQGGVNMCKAMDEWARMAKEKGREEGREEGRTLGIRMFILDNIEEGKTAQRIQEKLMRRFQLSAELAEQYYLQYAQG